MWWLVSLDNEGFGWAPSTSCTVIEQYDIEEPAIPRKLRALPPSNIERKKVVPRWSHLPYDTPEWEDSLSSMPVRTDNEDLLVLGIPKKSVMLAYIRSGFYRNFYFIGGGRTAMMFNDHDGSALDWFEQSPRMVSVHVINGTSSAFPSVVLAYFGVGVSVRFQHILCGLSVYRPDLEKSLVQFVLGAQSDHSFNLIGPAHGSVSTPPRPPLADSIYDTVARVAPVSVVGFDPRGTVCTVSGLECSVLPPHTCPGPPDPLGAVTIDGIVVAREGLDNALEHFGVTRTSQVATRAAKYVVDTNLLSPTAPILKDQSSATPYPTASQSSRDDYLNWDGWIAKATGAGTDLLVIGEMSGGSVAYLHNMYNHMWDETHILEAGPSWDNTTGVDKLCFFKHWNVPHDYILLGTTHNTAPLMATRQITRGREYLFVYHDGSHTADDTLFDLEAIWRALCVGGVIVVDDYIYHRVTGDSHEARAVYAGRRGILAFLELHRGDYVILPPQVPSMQLAFQKTRSTVRLIATEAMPFVEPDRTVLYEGNYPNPDLRDPWPYTGTVVDGDIFYDCIEGHSLAKHGAWSVVKMPLRVLAGTLDVGRTAGRAIGHGFELAGDWVGYGHQHDAIAGLGNAVKSVGHASKIVGDGLGAAALSVASFFVPKEIRDKLY